MHVEKGCHKPAVELGMRAPGGVANGSGVGENLAHPASGSLRGGRQELVVDQGLQCVAERVLGVNRLCEPGLPQLYRAHEGPRSFRNTVGEREVRVLVPLANTTFGFGTLLTRE
jgi:hypothetical protein